MTSAAVIPARNESATVARVVACAATAVDEVVVVASCCTDDTASIAKRAGARVVVVDTPGKHFALRAGILNVVADEFVFLDADLRNPSAEIPRLLLDALRSGPEIAIAKGYYSRSPVGRLTQLTAIPLLSMFLPSLASVRQPLTGEFAVRRSDIIDMQFAPGAAVDLGFLIHCAAKGQVREVDLGEKVHKHRSVEALAVSAAEVVWTVVQRAQLDSAGVVSVTPELLLPFVLQHELVALSPIHPQPVPDCEGRS